MMLKMLKPRVASMTLLCTMMFGGLPSAAQTQPRKATTSP